MTIFLPSVGEKIIGLYKDGKTMKLISKSVYVPFLYLLFDFFILILLFYISILIRLDILPSIFPNLGKSYIDLKSYLWVSNFSNFCFLV